MSVSMSGALLLLMLTIPACIQSLQVGNKYVYQYGGRTTLQNQGTFNITAKVTVTPLEVLPETVWCRLNINEFKVSTFHPNTDKAVNEQLLSVTKWFSFYVGEKGVISQVNYETNEDETIVGLQKIIVGTLSSTLVFPNSGDSRWGYKINETGQEGRQEAVYVADTDGKDIIFTREKEIIHGHVVEQKHKKKIRFDSKSGLITDILVADKFKTSDAEDDQSGDHSVEAGFDFPQVEGDTEIRMRLLKVDYISESEIMSKLQQKPDNLLNDTIVMNKNPIIVLPLEDIVEDFQSNYSCVLRYWAKKTDTGKGLQCFHTLVTLASNLRDADLEKLSLPELKSKDRNRKLLMVAVLGDMASDKSWQILVKRVLRDPKLDKDLIMKMLPYFIQKKRDIPKTVTDALEGVVKLPRAKGLGMEVLRTVYLILGALCNLRRKYDPEWSETITKELEKKLLPHDPWHLRNLKQTFTEAKWEDHLLTKSNLMSALSNAGDPGSVPIIETYINDTTIDNTLKSSAIMALQRFNSIEAADALMNVVLNPEEGAVVRQMAADSYKAHPLGGAIDTVYQIMSGQSVSNDTTPGPEEYRRVRRSLGRGVSRIWGGFHFILRLPPIDWSQRYGSNTIGGHLGVTIRNEVDINLGSRVGHVKVDIHNRAFARLHAFSARVEAARAEICLKFDANYNFNILQEFSFANKIRIARLFNRELPRLVGNLRGAINFFIRRIQPESTPHFLTLAHEMSSSLESMVHSVSGLRLTLNPAYAALGEVQDFSPQLTLMITELLGDSSKLFNQIKSDIMKVHKEIVDKTVVSLPWAWFEIEQSIKDVSNGFVRIVENPQTTVHMIGHAVERLRKVLDILGQTNNKISSGLFGRQTLPAWLPLERTYNSIKHKLDEISEEITKTVTTNNVDPFTDRSVKQVSGVSMRSSKAKALQNMLTILESSILQPIVKLRSVYTRFSKAISHFQTFSLSIFDGFSRLDLGFLEAMKSIEMVFGLKVHKGFPRIFLESEDCGNGFWPTDGHGFYQSMGVMLIHRHLNDVVAPFNGVITEVGENHVVLKMSDADDIEVVLSNINPRENLENLRVPAGAILGTLTHPEFCIHDHIHFAMRMTDNKNRFIDPTRYFDKPNVENPFFRKVCNKVYVAVMGYVIRDQTVLGGRNRTDETPKLDNAPDEEELELEPIESDDESEVDSEEKFRKLVFDDFEDIAKYIGMPVTMNKLEEVKNFVFHNIPLKKLLHIMEMRPDMAESRSIIIQQLDKIVALPDNDECLRPSGMSDTQLTRELVFRGLSVAGDRQNRIAILSASGTDCPMVRSSLGPDVRCRFDDSCNAMQCCLDSRPLMERKMISINIKACLETFSVLVDGIVKEISIMNVTDIEDSFLVPSLHQLNSYLEMAFNIKRDENKLQVSVSLAWCSNITEFCAPPNEIITNVELKLGHCVEEVIKAETKVNQISKEELMLKSIQEVLEIMDFYEVDETEVHNGVQTLRVECQEWLSSKVGGVKQEKFPNEFDLFEVSTSGRVYVRNLQRTFIDDRITIPFGPIAGYFGYGITGYFAMSAGAGIKLMSQSVQGTLTPELGTSAYGSLGIRIPLLSGEIRLQGNLISCQFPIIGEVGYSRFPLNLRFALKMRMVAVSLQLRLILFLQIFRRRIPFINMRLWYYEAASINTIILERIRAQNDDTPPEFSSFTDADARLQSSGNTCWVEQLKYRDFTEPAFQLAIIGVDDDMSDVILSYSVGTYRGGQDAVNAENLGGISSIVPRALPQRQRLYFTVTAENSMGLASRATCELPVYDMLPPGGRVTLEYETTSNPTIMHGTVMVVDESPIITNQVALGFGRGREGDQVVSWADIKDRSNAPVGATRWNSLDSFLAPRIGRLSTHPFRTTTFPSTLRCAEFCLTFNNLQCQSFNYDYGASGTCELLGAIESNHIHTHRSGSFHYYERRGVGEVKAVAFKNVNLTHNQLYYLNNHLVNRLGYTSILTSRATLYDMTPPTPNDATTMKEEYWINEKCNNYIPDHFGARCVGQTPIKNYRYFVDGSETRTIFNGPRILEEITYTRANTMVAANWDGIHDNQTGILIYEFAVGEWHCGDDIHPHRDPHAHIASSSAWTNQGMIHPVLMPDGEYHITVRALNDIVYGGPLVLAVCHSIPYTIDTVPPIVHYVTNVTYDEELLIIGVNIYATDETSGIGRIEFGLGNDRRNVYIMGYTDVEITSHIPFPFRVPDGVPVWVKIRVSDKVDLRDVGHPDLPIVVDMSAPLPGQVFDGHIRRHDMMYQNYSDKYCANWEGFSDPESGIAMYEIKLMDDNGETLIDQVPLSSRTHDWCHTDLNLAQNQTLFLSVTAVNAALEPRNAMVLSTGVSVDATPPTPGWVKDGLSPESDITFSSSQSSVSVTFGDFMDPESGLDHYTANIYSRGAGDEEETLAHSEIEIDAAERSLSLHHFHLQQGDTIRTEIESVNRAMGSVSVSSTGFIIDSTDPILEAMVDGLDIHRDLMFSSSLNDLSVTWRFRDPESGITRYLLSVFETFQGLKRRIYPKTGELELPGTQETYTVTGLDLQQGMHYSLEVVAVNGAELSYVHETTGVVIDTTPPMYLHLDGVDAGVISGQAEEIRDGVVIHNDKENLPAAWRGRDHESGILSFYVAIGSYEGGADILPFQDAGTSHDIILTGLDLKLTRESNVYYYITVYAVNGALMKSNIVSSRPIRVVAGDVAGITMDGPDMELDIDYQVDVGTLTATFSGFESEAHGIHHLEFSVGSQPNLDDVVPFSSQGLITQDHEGLDSKGQLQTLIQLDPGQSYHVTVRGITGAGNVLESPSNGVIPDITPPDIVFSSLLGQASLDEPVYVQALQPFLASWSVQEQESQLGDTILSVFNVNGDNFAHKNISMLSSLPPGMVDVFPEYGSPVFTSISSQNVLGLVSTTLAPEVTADSDPPAAGLLECPKYITTSDFMLGFECTWDGYIDRESGISHHKIGLGLEENDDSLVAFRIFDSDSSNFYLNTRGVPLAKEQRQVVVSLEVTNNIGASVFGYARIVIDDTDPISGTIHAVTDTASFNMTIGHTTLDTDNGVLCQRSADSLTVVWDEFIDHESPITGYYIAVGLRPGGQDVHKYSSVPKGRLWQKVTGVHHHRILYATVVGYNAAGLTSMAVSDAIYMSSLRTGAGGEEHLIVRDGRIPGQDQSVQGQNTGLSANWEFVGDPCPIVKYEWEVRSFNGKIILPMEEIPQGRMTGMVDDVVLRDGESFYSIIRATNAIGDVISARSDGMTVQLEPLVPGNVRDGDIAGTDLMFWTHVDRLSANWDSFGGEMQEIAFYEVAAGTDRRFPTTRQNIHPFMNAGLNQTWTFFDLELLPNVATYYITVRAHSLSSSVSEITSTGVRVIYDFDRIPGEIQVSRFVATSDRLEFSWNHFDMGVPISQYMWGLGTWNSTVSALDCDSFIHVSISSQLHEIPSSNLFDVHELESVSEDTFVSVENINLQHGEDYHIIVIAVDLSARCAFSFTRITVDVTLPERGTVAVGNKHYQIENMAYTSSRDMIQIWWWGFVDKESGVDSYAVSLYQAESCTSGTDDLVLISEEMLLPQNSSSFAYFNKDLNSDGVYRIKLKVTNGAMRELNCYTSPILVEEKSPKAGAVKHGEDFRSNQQFQESTQEMTGSIIYWPDKTKDPCPPRLPISTQDYKVQESKRIVDVMNPDNSIHVQVNRRMVKQKDDGLHLSIERSVRDPIMYGASATITLGTKIIGSYEFELKTGDILAKPVTSIIFSEDDIGFVGDFLQTSEINSLSMNSHQSIENGFGLQILQDESNKNESEFILWCMRETEIWLDSKVLSLDASQDFVHYSINVKETMRSLDLSISVNDEEIFSVFGVNPLQTTGMLQLTVYPKAGHLLPLKDVFNPPSTNSIFQNIQLPTESTTLCRFGDTFQQMDQPVIVFLAGIGTQIGITDVLEPMKVYKPCIPCISECDINICDQTCSSELLQPITFTLSSLNLDPLPLTTNNSIEESLLQPYYITVFAETGSGRHAIKTSDGVYIDVTPPNITHISHRDLTWNMFEATSFQGNNYSIAIYWEAGDPESQIVRYEWGIGSSPGSTDIQDFTEIIVRDNSTAINDDLEGKLYDKQTYYVTLRVMNGANVWDEIISDGVTVWLEEPNVDGIQTKWLNTESHPGVDGFVFLTRQDEIGLTWPTAPEEEHISRLYNSLLDEGSKELLPHMIVGFNESGFIVYQEHFIDIKGMEDEQASLDGHLLLEPGRILASELLVCNKANLCGKVISKPVIIKRTRDLISYNENKIVYIDGSFYNISTEKGQPSNTILISGELSKEDITMDYMFYSSVTYSPYIVNPKLTQDKTSRSLRSRIIGWEGRYLYLTSAPGSRIYGELNIDIYHPGWIFQRGTIPLLLAWCPDQEIWADVVRSCPGDHSTYQKQTGDFQFRLCDIQKACQEDYVKITGTDKGFVGSVFLALARISSEFQNSPPVITSPGEFEMDEDTNLQVQLTATDPDGDRFIFLLQEEYTDSYPGEVTLSHDGELHVKPNPNYFGIFIIYFKVKEQPDIIDISPLTVKSNVSIVVHPVNDNPVLNVVEKGYNLLSHGNHFNWSLEQKTDDLIYNFSVLLVSYDVDIDDKVHILINPGANGTTLLSHEIREIKLVEQDCSQGWEDRRYSWEKLSSDLWLGRHPVYKPIICNQHPFGLEPGVVWSVIELMYISYAYPHGQDLVVAIAEDRKQARSERLDLHFHVLEFPCLHGSRCVGPANDPDCRSVIRAQGFHENGYTCMCEQDYTGRNCETEIDNCLSDPCPYNYTCKDGVGHYTCSCDSIWWPCYSGLLPWELALIVGIPLIAIIIALIIFLVIRYNSKHNKIGDSTVSLTKADEFESLSQKSWKSASALGSLLSVRSTKVHPQGEAKIEAAKAESNSQSEPILENQNPQNVSLPHAESVKVTVGADESEDTLDHDLETTTSTSKYGRKHTHNSRYSTSNFDIFTSLKVESN